MWGAWALSSLALLFFVAIFSIPFPFGDEWEWLGRVTGKEPITLAWLWSQHNEHRMFLPRLIYLGLGKLTGYDFQAGSFFNILILSALSAAMILTARKIRGKTMIYDMFFPFLLLHFGQAENLIWGFQLNFITAVVLEGIVLLTVVRCNQQTGIRPYLLTTVCLLLLGCCGTYGLVFLPPMAFWMLFASINKWRDGSTHGKRDAVVISFFSMLVIAFTIGYFYGLHTSVSRPIFFAAFQTAAQFLSYGIGPAAVSLWPISGLVVLAVCAIFVWQCLRIFISHPSERVRIVGMLMYFAGFFALASAIGWGRAYIGPMAGFELRYMTLAAPLLLLLFFYFDIYGTTFLQSIMPLALCSLMGILLVVNTQKGISYSINLRTDLKKFEQDMRDDVPPDVLGQRYSDQWGYGNSELLTTRLMWLREAGLGPYRGKRPED